MTDTTFPTQFEEDIFRAFDAPEARPEFTDRLYRDLMQRAEAGIQKRKRVLRLHPAWVTALIILLISIVVLAVGPKKVYAALQSLFGYVPGAGFISTEGGLALREPLEKTQNGLTFRVEQLLATPEGTVLVARFQGVDANQETGLDQVWIALEGGQRFRAVEYGIESTGFPGEFLGVFKYRPLPGGTKTVMVAWQGPANSPNHRSVPWQMLLELSPLTDPAVALNLPNAYTPKGASASQSGITLEIERVSSSQKDTAVWVKVIFPEVFSFVELNSVTLIDDSGKQVQQKNTGIHFEDQGQAIEVFKTPGAPLHGYKSLYWTLDFPAIDPSVQKLTLQVNRIGFRAEPAISYPIELGPRPAVGDSWPIHEILTIGAISLEVKQARMVELTSAGQPMAGLVLDIAPHDPAQVQLTQVWLSAPGSVEIFDETSQTWAPAWQPQAFPRDHIDIRLTLLDGVLNGDWNIQWEHLKP